MYIGVGLFPTNTLMRSSGFNRSRSAVELLRKQKTKLPQPLDGLLRKARRHILMTYLGL
jgi:hypothetical protein